MTDIQEYLNNFIKQHILGLLIKNKRLKYSELMPKDVDNVLFNYHLQHLVKLGLLDKHDNYYSLSTEGLKATSNITDNGLYFPKFVCKYRMYLIHEGKVLFQYRKRNPWFGDTTALSSKLLYGSNVNERANFRFKEKSGLEVQMNWIGTIRTIAMNSQRNILDDSVYFVCYANSFTGELNKEDDSGDPLIWIPIEKALEVEEQNRGSGEFTLEVLKRFSRKDFSPFNFEETIEVESI